MRPVETLASTMLLFSAMRKPAKKILIVDDDNIGRESLGALIRGLGYEVCEAASGLEAIEAACNVRPHLIMMGLRLPGMNGDEVTKRLKAKSATRNIPVVISTAWTTVCNVGDRIDRALEAGAEEILYKPFHASLLRDVLRTYLLA
jgi:CheY-like chemotaxis protein